MTIIDRIIEAEGDTFKITRAELLELQKLQNDLCNDELDLMITDLRVEWITSKKWTLSYCGKVLEYVEGH